MNNQIVKVYIAGRYNDENIIKCLANIRNGIRAARKAIQEGYVPFCPWLDFLFNLICEEPLTREEYHNYSMQWVDSCDEIWMLPSWINSNGAKAEMERAKEKGIKVVYLDEKFERFDKVR